MPIPINIAPLPIKTDRTLKSVPYATYAICFLCVAIYLWTLNLSYYQLQVFAGHWGFVASHPTVLALCAHMFVHVTPDHLLGNMCMLWLVGTVLESGIGPWRLLCVYVASALAAVGLFTLIAVVFLHEALDLPMLGASGGISGVLGMTVFRYYRLRVSTLFFVQIGPLPLPIPYPVWIPMWSYAALFTVREIVAGVGQLTQHGLGSMVAHWAHIGGLGLGVLAAMLLQSVRAGKREYALEDTTKAGADPNAGKQTLRHVRHLLLDDPHDPELLEARAGLTLAQGETLRARELYQRAMKGFFTAGKPERAAIIFLNILQTNPDFTLPVRDQLRIASALEAIGRYREAAQVLEHTAEQYRSTPEAQNALLRAAQLYHRQLLDSYHAYRILVLFFERYPGSTWTELAKKRLQELQSDAPPQQIP